MNTLMEEDGKDEKKTWQRPTLPQRTAVPSARGRFTSVFGMGTGVAALLWPPGDHRAPSAGDPFRKPER